MVKDVKISAEVERIIADRAARHGRRALIAARVKILEKNLGRKFKIPAPVQPDPLPAGSMDLARKVVGKLVPG